MSITSSLATLAGYLAGEFDNRPQAMADPAWYVHLRLWQRPLPGLFDDRSVAFFLEQANATTLDRPYRQRIARLEEQEGNLRVQYYMLKQRDAYIGGGDRPEKLASLTPSDLHCLPGCRLEVTQETIGEQLYRFRATMPDDAECCFTYGGETRWVKLGFEATATEFFSYDKGVDPTSGRALWGAMLGPFQFAKVRDFVWTA
ncbi:MAG: chorismate mutase [Coleofasciculaceae cyanobacterium SM2_3_26]|nr:chorismate mutase [Coleofasciculaceae cyanobacterium SM2_3_26]